MKERIRDRVLGLGADVCGFASIDRFGDAPEGFHPCDIYDACKTVIVFGIALPKGLYMVEPRLVYGHFNETAFPKLDQIALQTAKWIEDEFDGLGVPMPCDSPYEYWDEEKMEGRGLVSMRHAAVNAGLGRLGKSSLLLNTNYGNRLGFGCVLTNLSFDSDEMQHPICVENCRLCIEKCPSKALSGVHTTQKNCRIHTYGTNKRGYGTVDCNQCRTVCPMRFGVSR
jgi:epoxyqueuosine reductase